MKIWVYLNGIQQGPYTIEDLQAMQITPSTPVWYEGLSQWLPACEAPLTASLFGDSTIDCQTTETTKPVNETIIENFTPHSASAATDAPKCPATFIGWSVFCLICCCMPGGILGIIFSSMVKSAYSSGDYAKAEKMSEYAEWSVILSIVLGLIFAPFTWILYM